MKNQKIYTTYDRSCMDKAIESVKAGNMKITAAARIFGVPRKTLDDRIKGYVDADARAGRKFYLDPEETQKLVDYFSYLSQRGFPLVRQKMRPLLRHVTKQLGKDVFCSDGPSDQWFRTFFKRYPNLQECSQKFSSKSSKYRRGETLDHILDQTISRLGLTMAQVFNCGECCFTCEEQDYASAMKLSGEDVVTCLSAVSGDGQILPSAIVFKDTLPSLGFWENVPSDWLIGTSDSGFMKHKLFNRWFENVFLRYCGSPRPVILLLSDSESHLSYSLIQRAQKENVELIFYPAENAKALMPIDLVMYEIRKKLAIKASSLHLISDDNVMSRSRIPVLWHLATNDFYSPVQIRNAFLKSEVNLTCSTSKNSKNPDIDPSDSALKSSTSARTSRLQTVPSRTVEVVEEKATDTNHDLLSDIYADANFLSSSDCGGAIPAIGSVDVLPSASVPAPAETIDISDQTQYCPHCHQVWDESEAGMHGLIQDGHMICRRPAIMSDQPTDVTTTKIRSPPKKRRPTKKISARKKSKPKSKQEDKLEKPVKIGKRNLVVHRYRNTKPNKQLKMFPPSMSDDIEEEYDSCNEESLDNTEDENPASNHGYNDMLSDTW